MTARISVNAADLLKWARYLDDVPKQTRPAIARAMNDYGRGVLDSTAAAIAEQTGLPVAEVRGQIDIKQATSNDLTWKMDASKVAKSDDWERPWDRREDKSIDQQALVKIVTSGDESTCEICEEAASRSPYTMEEINSISAKWKHWQPETGLGARTNLLHPNCRCMLQPWRQTRRVAVKFGGKGAPPELLNARQLGRKVADEMKVTIRAIKI
ncbi:MAG TPA: hypothetical protein VIZ32_03210 [Vicinamibacterales bacterium]